VIQERYFGSKKIDKDSLQVDLFPKPKRAKSTHAGGIKVNQVDKDSQYYKPDKYSQYKKYISKFESFLRFFKQIFTTIEDEKVYFEKLDPQEAKTFINSFRRFSLLYEAIAKDVTILARFMF
jgi:hypothetical protein